MMMMSDEAKPHEFLTVAAIVDYRGVNVSKEGGSSIDCWSRGRKVVRVFRCGVRRSAANPLAPVDACGWL